jgi:triosephosphate isomerase
MSDIRRKLVVGNWKMHGTHATNEALLEGLKSAGPLPCEAAVCAPFPYLAQAAERLARSAIAWGAQDCSVHEQGAYTGEVSVAMLADFGCRYVIVGHSERRALHAESDQLVADKAQAALAKGVTPIVCVGETLAQRDAGETEDVVKRQLSAVIHTLAHCVGEMVVADRKSTRLNSSHNPASRMPSSA